MTSLPPPASGTYAYNGFVPGTIYVDPVFQRSVWRVTRDHGKDNIYARNHCWNANETLYLHRTEGVPGKPDAWDVIEVSTGEVTHAGIPFGSIAADGGFDPIDPNVILALSGEHVMAITLQTGGHWISSPFFTAPSLMKDLGGSINWMSGDGETMLVRYGAEPSAYVYRHGNLSRYSNPIDASNTVGRGSYLGMAPNGNYVVGYDSRPVGVSKVGQGVSWWIDHGTRTVAAAPNVFWSLCGDHGSFICPSDGRTYMITYACYGTPGLWRVDVTNNAEGLGEASQMALPNNKLLIPFATWNDFGHVTTVARGPWRDWAFISTEDSTDHFDGPVDPWHPYRQEIVAVNVLTAEVRRLAHHRSRSLEYDSQPRVSASWGGAFVGFASNYNQRGVVDIFAIPFAGNSPEPPPVTQPPAAETLPITVTLGDKTYVGTVTQQ
jgi:hypothetical protein